MARAIVHLGGERLVHHVVERQEARIDVARLRARAGANELGRLAQVFAAERRLAAPELEEQRGHREDVGRGRQLEAVDAAGRRRLAAIRTPRAVLHAGARRDAKIDDFDLPLFVEHHIARRDVAVNHLHAAVRVVERAADLDADVRPFFGREARLVARQRLQQLCAREPFDELHREEVRPELDPQLVDGDDVRVAERDGRLRLFDEAPAELVVA